jgi:hypothetical protein
MCIGIGLDRRGANNLIDLFNVSDGTVLLLSSLRT